MSGRMEIRGSASTIISTIIIASRPAVVNVSAGTRIETITWQTPPPPRDLTFFKKYLLTDYLQKIKTWRLFPFEEDKN